MGQKIIQLHVAAFVIYNLAAVRLPYVSIE